MNFFKCLRKDSLATAVAYLITGIILVLFPETTAKTIGYAFACVLLALGIGNIFNYMMRDARTIFYHNDLVLASILLVAGVAVFINVEAVVGFIPFILGVFVLISGVLKLQNAMNLKRLNQGGSAMVLILAIANVLFGVILILNPFHAVVSLIMILGIGLIFSGITDLIVNICIAKKIRIYDEDNSIIEGVVVSEENENHV